AKENQVVSAEKNLPQTGDSNTANAIALLLGYLSVFAGIFVGFRKKPDKTK
ncbi:LPXTG cell wall anchor domain-containing protein, partial [Streptococcus sobrinus]